MFETDEERTAFVIRLPVHPLAKTVTPEVTGEVERLLRAMASSVSKQDRVGAKVTYEVYETLCRAAELT